jgi:hypothetical protein
MWNSARNIVWPVANPIKLTIIFCNGFFIGYTFYRNLFFFNYRKFSVKWNFVENTKNSGKVL